MSTVVKKFTRFVLPSAGTPLHEKLRKDGGGFRALADILRSLSGIHMPLNPKNQVLMACRLAPLFKKLGIESYQSYLIRLRQRDPKILQEFVEAMTTNTTEFFREAQHFDLFPKILGEICDRKHREGSQDLRLWCAAASSGQEAYTMMMALKEALPMALSWDVRMLASDIDRDALRKASRGLYKASELRNVTDPLMKKYFMLQQNGPDPWYRTKRSLKNSIVFAEFNLITEVYPFRYPFDIIFCRNVLIYFDAELGKQIVEKLAASLAIGGFLFVGHSETGLVRSKNLRMEANAVYRRIR